MVCLRIGGVALLLTALVLGCQSSPDEAVAPEQEAASAQGQAAPEPAGQEPTAAEPEAAASKPQIDPAAQQEARQKLEAAGVEISEASLRSAAQSGNLDNVQLLITAGVDLDAQDADGWSALFFAAESGHAEVAKALIEGGANTEVKDLRGNTALHWAAGGGHIETLAVMIDGGSAVDPENTSGFTPMLAAWHNQREEAVEFLISKGAENRRRQ